MLAWKLRGAGLVVPLTLAFASSANSTAQTITWPSIQAGDIAFLSDRAIGLSAPSEVIPSGFTKIAGASVTSGIHRLTVSYKILSGSESGSLTGQNGNSSNQKVMQIFRPSQAVSTINFGGLTVEQTNNNPASRSLPSSGSRTPSIVFGIVSAAAATTSFATASPAFDGTDATSNTRMVMGYKIYNTSPADHTIDMGDPGSDNIFSTFCAQFGASQQYANGAYDAAVAAITNKTIYCRADPSFALGDTLTGLEWDNEAVATPNLTGTATMEPGVLNGYRGVLADASGEYANTTSTLSTTLAGSGLSYTLWAVEKRSGTQGSNAANNRYLNSATFKDASGYVGVVFNTSSRRFLLYSFDTSAHFYDTGIDFTDNAAYVLAVKVNADGSGRTNFNGTVNTFAAGTMTDLGSFAAQTRFNQWAAGTNYGFEYILSSDAVSNTDMDNLVNALRTKWGIS